VPLGLGSNDGKADSEDDELGEHFCVCCDLQPR
jgi:hypothetical protein